MMIKRYIYAGLLWLSAAFALTARADDHTQFMGLPLSLAPGEMVDELRSRGLRQDGLYSLSGRISGLDVRLSLHPDRDSMGIGSMVLTTLGRHDRSQRDDYSTLMAWMRHHYGAPAWESFVRGHQFARWYVGFDRDIVMIATAKSSVEVWFYDNHRLRNIDYYSILKYCERNPSEAVPYYTARECVTWRSSTPPVTKRAVKGKGRQKVRKTLRTRHSVKARGKARTRHRRR